MSDVSTWSPLDANNNAPTPDGWPEFQMPSTVNNCGRAMMGAVRRMYDEMVAGSLVLPYLKLSGGTVTGAVTVSGALTAGSITCNSTIYATSGISTGGSVNASGNVTASLDISGRNLSVQGSIATGPTGGINTSQYQINGVLFGTNGAGNTYLYDGGGAWTLALGTSDNISANNRTAFNSRGNGVNFAVIDANGLFMAVGNISTPGSVSASLDVTAARNMGCGTLYVTTVSAAGNVTASNISVSGQITATGALQSNRGDAYALFAPNGGITCALDISGRNIYANGSVNITNGSVNISGSGGVGGGDLTVAQVLYAHDVMPSVDNVSICGGAASAWNVVESYNFITKSDVALKTGIGPLPDTLTLVAALAPKAFQYEGDDDRRHWGFVAQDVRAAVSNYPVDLVTGEEGRLGLDYNGLTAMLWKAVQELAARLTALEGR